MSTTIFGVLTFERWHRVTQDLSPQRRCELFEHTMAEELANCWARLREQVEGQRILNWDAIAEGPPPKRERVKFQRVPLRGGGQSARGSADDQLLTVDPPDYFEALAGVEVPSGGGFVSCPFPDHEDWTPSCQVFAEAGRGFRCFGCGRSGSVYDFARELSGIGDRGPEFLRLRAWIAERLLGAAA